MAFLSWLENTGFANWERESLSMMAYPFILFLHTFGLAFLVGPSVALSLRILGIAPDLPLAPMEKFYKVMMFGFWVNAITGLLLIPTQAINFFTMKPVFYIKLGLIALAVVDMQMIRREVFHSNRASLDTTPLSTKAKTLAATLLLLWGGATIAGRVMAYKGFVERQTALAVIIFMVVAAAVMIIATRLLGWNKPLRQDTRHVTTRISH